MTTSKIEITTSISDVEHSQLIEQVLTVDHWYTILIEQTVINNIYTFHVLFRDDINQISLDYFIDNTHPIEHQSCNDIA